MLTFVSVLCFVSCTVFGFSTLLHVFFMISWTSSLVTKLSALVGYVSYVTLTLRKKNDKLLECDYCSKHVCIQCLDMTVKCYNQLSSRVDIKWLTLLHVFFMISWTSSLVTKLSALTSSIFNLSSTVFRKSLHFSSICLSAFKFFSTVPLHIKQP
jgi:hypothetical protein